MRVAVTGATGFIGHWTVSHLLASGHEVLALGRKPSAHWAAGFRQYDLAEPPPSLSGVNALVHAAFSHVAGKYRGGEGEDSEGFIRLNLDGTIRLFEAARDAGVRRIVFLSSRAVYGAYPPGTRLHEDLEPRPDTLYGRMKYQAEHALASLATNDLAVANLRVTGVFGPPVPGLIHKWADLLSEFGDGKPVEPRASTEVHALDVADAVLRLIEADRPALTAHVFNVSDFVLDRRDLLAAYSRISGVSGALPDASDHRLVSQMTVDRLKRIGWEPAHSHALHETLEALAGQLRAHRKQ